MERLFDGMDQENSKTHGGKGQIRRIQKNKKERMEERKRRDFLCTWMFPYSCVLHQSGTPLCDFPSGEPTQMGTSPTRKS